MISLEAYVNLSYERKINMDKLGLLYGLYGGAFSFLAFILLQIVFRATDVQGFVLVGTIVLSAVISCCTGILLGLFKDIQKKKNI